MATLSNMVCLVIHRNVTHRFRVEALQDPPLCSSTEMVTFDFLESVPLGDGPARRGEHVRPVAQLRTFRHAPQLHLSCITSKGYSWLNREMDGFLERKVDYLERLVAK
jgi:hypothetical protein